jgi:hypothetical protein
VRDNSIFSLLVLVVENFIPLPLVGLGLVKEKINKTLLLKLRGHVRVRSLEALTRKMNQIEDSI